MKTSNKSKNKETKYQEKKEKSKSEMTENLVAISIFILLIIIGISIFTKGFGLLRIGNETSNVRINVPLGNDPFTGNPNASIIIIAFSDYECPFCTRAEQTMKSIREKYEDDIVYVFKDYPLTRIHPYAYNASLAAECAKEQDKYWVYHDYLYEHNNHLENRYLEEYARLLGLDIEQFNECLETQRYKGEVEEDIQTGISVGVTGIPTFFINGIKVIGAQSEQKFIKIINKELRAKK